MQQTVQYNYKYFTDFFVYRKFQSRHPCGSTWMYLIIRLFCSLFRNFKTIKRFGPEFLESNSLQYFINCIHRMYSTTTVYIYIKSLYIQSEFYHFLFCYYYIFFFFQRPLSISGQKLFHAISLLDDFVDLIWTIPISNFEIEIENFTLLDRT